MLGIELNATQERTLRLLVGILDEAGACYQFTGGFAGNLHGSRRPLHDLDIDVTRADMPQLAELLLPYTTRPLGPYADDEFELVLLRAEAEGVGIDVSQAEEANAGDPVDRPRQLLAACLGTASDKVGNGRPVQPLLAQVQQPPLLAQPAAGFRQQLPSRPCFCG